ncbi:MAG: hypothetical protein WC654_04015 [Patescibacteria group bacterium]
MGLKDFFWSSKAPTSPTDEADGTFDGSLPSAADDASSVPVGVTKHASTTSVVNADFPTIYAQTNVIGDPKADALLAAYAGLASMDEASRRMAVQAVLTGMQAQAPVILQTLEKRTGLLKFLVQEENKKLDKNKQGRVTEITRNQETTDTEVARLEKEIAVMRATLEQLRQRATRADQEEEATVDAFGKRVEVEAQRLNGLLGFLKGMVPQQQGKK